MSDKVKVVGYAQRVFYDNGIEYRNFSDDLVGFQLTSNGGNTLFTSGNFNITSKIDKKPSKLFTTKKFTGFFTLENLNVTAEMSAVIQNSIDLRLNLDKANICNHAYFGSFTEFVRVSLENIIINWPASIQIVEREAGKVNLTGNTMENYSYDPITNKSKFTLNIDRVRNPYSINLLQNGSILNTFNETNPLRNMTASYTKYVVDNSFGEFPIIGFTGATTNSNDTLYFEVKGDSFPNLTTSTERYHIRPNTQSIEIFYKGLNDFESNLLNRDSRPKYKSSYTFNSLTDQGAIVTSTAELIWPVTDGYNLDFDTNQYELFVSDLLDITTNSDNTKTDLIVRYLVAESISDFDTLPKCDGITEELSGQKITSTLRIYGREFDEIKRYIEGIQFSNVVTYNRVNNTPDVMLKYLARVMGWELVSSVVENDLLKAYLEPSASTYAGKSRGFTPQEAEFELWRRLILNTPWLWKSKGTRKGVEFIFKFIGTPENLVTFNEYIYVAKNPVNYDLVVNVNEQLAADGLISPIISFDGEVDLTRLWVDSDGYPMVQPDNPDMYFQKGGLWYRETGGPNPSIDLLNGNNPHVGPYDGGKEYISNFECLVPNFSATTLYNQTITTGMTNIFTNYNSGLFNSLLDDTTYVNLVNLDNIELDCYDIDAEIIQDPFPVTERTDCGCETGDEDQAMRINIRKIDPQAGTPMFGDCGFTGFTLDGEGFVIFQASDGIDVLNVTRECCEALGFTYEPNNSISCYWKEGNSCKDYEPFQIQIGTGLVVWYNPTTQTTLEIVSAECCEAYGYTPISASKGGYQCYQIFQEVDPCEGLNESQVQLDGLVVFSSPDGRSVVDVNLECCTSLGYDAVPSNTMKGKYNCYVRNTGVDIGIPIDDVGSGITVR